MTDTATSVPIPASESIVASNPFDDVKSPITTQAGMPPLSQSEFMSPPPAAPSPSHFPMTSTASSPSMMPSNFMGMSGGQPGAGGPPQNWPGIQNNGPLPGGFRPQGGPPGMPQGMGMPGGMNPRSMHPGFMNGMPPGMNFPGAPQNNGFPAGFHQNRMGMRNPAPGNPGQAGNQPMMNSHTNEPDEMNEILQIRDSLSEFTQNEKPSPLMPLSQNEKSKCGKCKSDIFPKADIEELVRCFSCKTWFRRTCVGLSELAYKRLVMEQEYVAWSCQSCIENKVVNSIVPKIEKEYCTNRPVPPDAPVHALAKPEKRDRKSRKTSKNGKAKTAAPSIAGPPQMRPPMAMDPRFASRMMHPGMMQRMNPMMMNRHPMMGGMMPPGMMHPGMQQGQQPRMPPMSQGNPTGFPGNPNDQRFQPPGGLGGPGGPGGFMPQNPGMPGQPGNPGMPGQPGGMPGQPLLSPQPGQFDPRMNGPGAPVPNGPGPVTSLPSDFMNTNAPNANASDDPLSEITGLDPLSDTKTEPVFSSAMDFNAIMSSMQSGAPGAAGAPPSQEETVPKSEPMTTNQSEMNPANPANAGLPAISNNEPMKTENPAMEQSAEQPKTEPMAEASQA